MASEIILLPKCLSRVPKDEIGCLVLMGLECIIGNELSRFLVLKGLERVMGRE